LDTKWKNRKKGISFIIFFLAVSLMLGNGISISRRWSEEISPGQRNQILEEDYQQGWSFRNHITNRLEVFLLMATNSLGNNFYGYGWEFEEGGSGDALVEETVTAVAEDVAQLQQGAWQEYGYEYGWDGYFYEDDRTALTEEQRKKIAQKFHDRIKGDQNLLYSVAYDGKVLYTNSEALIADGAVTLPEGYNFLLRYENGKVQIFKDGKELEIYGDGYYRENNQWYVPGYRNFQADENMKKAVIYMAAAENPVLYTEGIYGTSGYRTLECPLYEIHYHFIRQKTLLLRNLAGLAVSLILLLLSFLTRKSRKEAEKEIARFTGKIWVEGKILLPVILLSLSCVSFFSTGYGYELLREITYITAYESTGYLPELGFYWGETIRNLPAVFWLLGFWWIYLAINDLRYNKKVWRHGLAAKLRRSFTARDLQQPLSVRAGHRNAAAFAAAAVFGVLMLAGGVSGYTLGHHSAGSVWGIGSLFFLILVGFLILQYRIGVKNMELARDLEILSCRVRDIRDGNYTGSGGFTGNGNGSGSEGLAGDGKATGNGAFSENEADTTAEKNGLRKNPSLVGHDLEETMAQLEDIRHDMIKAVDEQMKSERMKVELIANVSHDIKTPLTSIISYVQFLKEEKELPEHVRDYVTILDEKSQRLKNMVQDVFAVSKAASGELPVHMEELDFGKLLRQTLADMEEQIEGSRVTFRTEIPETPVMIRADGQRLYRVFQNLFQNAIQYSLDGSRVFVTLQDNAVMAIASVKNTSMQELERDKDFTERFTRGDKSRTDGGSGLGLSIAQSFTEACGGSFSWETNADLFVVTVSFQISEAI